MNNSVCILPTEKCGLNCPFCSYSARRNSTASLRELSIINDTIRTSLADLVMNSSVIIFSGGGEPLLNLKFIEDTMLLVSNKQFVITTGLGIESNKLVDTIDHIDRICSKNSSSCSIRISVDRYHLTQYDYRQRLSLLLHQSISSRWKCCSIDSIRTIFIDRGFTNNLVSDIAKMQSWNITFDSDEIDNSKIIVNDKILKIEYKPLIHPERHGIKDIFSMEEYLNILDNSSNRFFVPRKDVLLDKVTDNNEINCNQMEGLSLTVDVSGNVYIYGVELSKLGNISDEILSFDQIVQRLFDTTWYDYFEANSIKDIMQAFLSDLKLGKLVRSINYPYEVIRELNDYHNEELNRYLLRLVSL